MTRPDPLPGVFASWLDALVAASAAVGLWLAALAAAWGVWALAGTVIQ